MPFYAPLTTKSSFNIFTLNDAIVLIEFFILIIHLLSLH